MAPRAFLFDLDGTLLDTEILWVKATEEYVAANGGRIEADEALRIVYGRAWSDVRSELVRRLPHLNRTAAEMQADLKAHLAPLRQRQDVRIAPSIELLRRLAARWPVAIVSGSPREDVEYGIDLMGIRPLLALSLASEDYTPGKPDPACFRAAADRLGVPPTECVVFEDSAAGVKAAKAAGMYCVALVRPGRPAQDVSAADERLPDLGAFRLPA
jgi:HAD superfamily hydrolase (TIGR01509 family)